MTICSVGVFPLKEIKNYSYRCTVEQSFVFTCKMLSKINFGHFELQT